MPTVKNLTIVKKSGTDNTYYATWEFDGADIQTSGSGSGSSGSTNIKKGDKVKVKQGAKWYNGAAIPSYVFNDTWIVYEVIGDRVVINKNTSGTQSIMSPIKASNLTKVSTQSLSLTGDSGAVVLAETTDNHLSHYELMWAHYTGQGMWFHDSDATSYAIKGAYDGSATYDPPDEAIMFRVQVRPVSTTYKVDDKDVSYWTGTWKMATYYNEGHFRPDPPSTPSVEINGLTLTATVDGITDAKTLFICFEIYDNTTLYNTSGTITVAGAMAEYQCAVNAGGNYRVRAKAGAYGGDGISLLGDQNYVIVWSDWSDFSGGTETIPTAPTGITSIRAASSTSVYLSWNAVTTADTYEIEYTTNPAYFEGSNATTSISGIETTQYTVTGLENGDEYYFRVRSVNDQGHSDWTEPRSVIIGSTPGPPTTWSSATTVIVGDPLNLYWVHNSKDNSWETFAQIEMYINDVKQAIITVESDQEDNPDDDTDTEKTHVYAFDTTKYPEGTTLKWRVRTAGITETFGDWSIQRQVDIYARPTLSLNVTDYQGQTFETLARFPFTISAFAGPKTQEPIGYHVQITSLTGYETVDNVGEDKIVSLGDIIYSKYFDTNAQLDLTLSASDLDLMTGQTYLIDVIVSMNSGLTAQSSRQFNVSWESETFYPNVSITIDRNTYSAYLVAACYTDGEPSQNVTLSIYRRDYDGGYTLIAEGLDPTRNTMVTDPHVSLDYARYRVIAESTLTGEISYYDPPAYPVSISSVETPIIIQWDEVWKNFDTSNPFPASDPLWAGSMIQIPWNIKVSENSSADSTLVNYMGRTYPVSYYGDSISTTASWSFEFPKTDKDMIYALRRLQIWAGDVYVREPEGSGYWANVGVSFNLDHDSLSVPVTLDITRVEGGM